MEKETGKYLTIRSYAAFVALASYAVAMISKHALGCEPLAFAAMAVMDTSLVMYLMASVSGVR